ncbi:hypothetical protein [Vagococcus sp.]|uniref:hypothetical protein n=1 Tax=Vagococcus sp. TaxID=1933889 RepID=UPI003F9C6D8A
MVDKNLKSIEKNYAVKSRYLNKKNACIYVDISEPTSEKWLVKGLPITKIDGTFRIDMQEIDKFMIETEYERRMKTSEKFISVCSIPFICFYFVISVNYFL